MAKARWSRTTAPLSRAGLNTRCEITGDPIIIVGRRPARPTSWQHDFIRPSCAGPREK